MLRLTQTQLKIFDSLYDGVVIADHEGRVVYVNEANERITGVPRVTAIGKLAREVVSDTALPAVLASGEAQIGVRTRVGSKEVLSNIVPIWHRGMVAGAVSVFRDVSEVHALGRKLKKAEHQISRLARELESLRLEGKDLVIGVNPAASRCFQLAEKAAKVNSPVLLQGESGTGKEVLARYIHRLSSRSEGSFIAINCGAIPEQLLESELFGYEEGAFTGAKRGGQAGMLEMASGGTVFLDEIGDMPLNLQVKLLRVLQDGEVKRLGSTKSAKVDFRVIAASNKPLERLMARGEFRDDLFYRLSVIPISLPPLRARREDLPRLITALTAKLQDKLNCELCITPPAMRLLLAYNFPGNIRELENILEGAAVVCSSGRITPADLQDFLHRNEQENRFPQLSPADMERKLILEGLAAGKKKELMAAELGISRATLYRRIAFYTGDKKD